MDDLVQQALRAFAAHESGKPDEDEFRRALQGQIDQRRNHLHGLSSRFYQYCQEEIHRLQSVLVEAAQALGDGKRDVAERHLDEADTLIDAIPQLFDERQEEDRQKGRAVAEQAAALGRRVDEIAARIEVAGHDGRTVRLLRSECERLGPRVRAAGDVAAIEALAREAEQLVERLQAMTVMKRVTVTLDALAESHRIQWDADELAQLAGGRFPVALAGRLSTGEELECEIRIDGAGRVVIEKTVPGELETCTIFLEINRELAHDLGEDSIRLEQDVSERLSEDKQTANRQQERQRYAD